MGIGREGAGMFGSMSSMFGDNSLNIIVWATGQSTKKLHVLNAVQRWKVIIISKINVALCYWGF